MASRLLVVVVLSCLALGGVLGAGVQIRGVNLGGWLVLEPWITPSIFDKANALVPGGKIVDQYTLCKYLGPDIAQKMLEDHWENWLLEDDIKTLAGAGITHLRVPFGYWMIDPAGGPWVGNDYPHLVRLLGYAAKYNLRVLLDLHGALGSQNGFDNSGVRGDIWWPQPDSTGATVNISHTLNVIDGMLARINNPSDPAYPFRSVVWGFELVNEPFATVDISTVRQFYYNGYNVVKSHNSAYAVVIHDSFRYPSWAQFMPPPTFQDVYLDTHQYQVFDETQLAWSLDQHIAAAWNMQTMMSGATLWTFGGEFCLAETDCTQYLNGYGVGARYDGTFPNSTRIGSCLGYNSTDTFTPEYRTWLNKFFLAQTGAFNSFNGWWFWNFKAESSPHWDYLLGLREGWIPRF
eukprot:gnl/Spiro4/13017_TR6899_c0_g1_i1.p1 gnl/Spiro4/13017_TR6899_c0_g1~~gnl/Spiro4/13017_TR6899_c0_g1_i1.p1  ORF type:complete len:427 (+),score=104.05 gnl/Spiro4/13017_TR6899_c0_g1_i1:69-1283(+)